MKHDVVCAPQKYCWYLLSCDNVRIFSIELWPTSVAGWVPGFFSAVTVLGPACVRAFYCTLV